MALNWNAFLPDDSLTLSDDQWLDIQQTTAGRSSEMPKSSSTRIAGSKPGDIAGFESFLNDTTGDPYLDDSLFNTNDYFLGDLEVLQPFGNTIGGDTTSESSPEPVSSISSTAPNPFQEIEISSASLTPASTSTGSKQSPQMPTVSKLAQRSQNYPNPSYESLFPNSLDAGFVEDITFPDGPTGRPSSTKSGADNDNSVSFTTVKRTKGNSKSDILTACWTSPLCPNHDQDGPPPNPSTCGSGCAPFLFANDDTLPTPTTTANILSEAQEVVADDGVVEIQPRPRKRTDSDASSEKMSGRQFPSKTASAVRTRAVKNESPQESPEPIPPHPSEEAKSKARRRLPHNQVERKYRESLNTQLESLRRVVPSLQQGARPCDDADIEDLSTASKPSKAVILASATAYIRQMEKEKKQMHDENLLLKKRVQALQALVKCEDCSLMQYVMDLKINQAAPAARA
ncbi:hypothetical protein BDV96DRAFT_498307 [Lophiotrema nucula]|uniref:BHLH domain-containing protein n=1 Tax=Lophiotrema nucula TaxID=690887 RepID=A0A6A5YY12_9PLEO|nr:hypothetical protein BDV96DRAFT_498307 [Lophiotrema nucula]